MLLRFIIFVLTFHTLGSTFDEDSPWLSSESEDLEDVCFTKECIVSAARILENMDITVNPCEDFYQFACGGYGDKTLAYDYRTVHVDSELDKTMQAQLKKLMQRPKVAFTGSTYKLKDLYDSCINIAYLEELGLTPLKDLLDHYGGWPITLGSKWDDSNFDWQKVVSQMIGDAIPVNLFSTDFDFNQGHLNSEMHAIPVIRVPGSQPFSLRNSSLINDTYMNPMLEIAVLLGASKEEAQYEMEEMFSFRNALNELFDSKINEDINDICITEAYANAEKLNSTTIGELYGITNELDWLRFLQRAFSPSLTMESEILCYGSSESFVRLIDFYNNAPKRVLANYLFSGIVRVLMSFIKSQQWDNIIMNARAGYIPERPISRWRLCLPLLDEFFLPIVTAMFVRHNYKSNEKENIAAMFSLIRTEFRNLFESAEWLADETLERGKEKIDDIIAFLVYADEILDDKKLEEYYRDVPISPNEFLKNVWNLKKFKHQKRAEYIDRIIIRSHWDNQLSLLMANAFYKPFLNSIDIPAAQARESFFTMNRPQALNFGSLGSIIGHEIGHAINQIGVPRRPEISVVKWWTDEDVIVFRQQAQCIIDQYGRYGLPKKGKINGTKTLDENIADNTGVLISYRAYQSWLKDHPGSEAKLPGLNFSFNQLFWMNYANSWCFSYSFTRNIPYISSSSHSWPKFRVWGSVSNSPDFARDFNCPLNSPMNPENKCSVW